MAIEKHLNITYVARSEETSWEISQMTEIVFVFEGRIGFWSRIWMTELRFAELLAFVSGFCTFIEGIYWCL